MVGRRCICMILASSRTGRGFNPRTVLLNLYDEKNTWVRVFFLLMQQSCLFAVNVGLESPKKLGDIHTEARTRDLSRVKRAS